MATVKGIIQEWLGDARVAWISSGGLHPFALLDLRVHDLSMKILTHVTELQAEPASEGLLDTQVSSEKQIPLVLEKISPVEETQAAAKEEPGLKEVSERAQRAMSRVIPPEPSALVKV